MSEGPLFPVAAGQSWDICGDFLDPLADLLEQAFLKWARFPMDERDDYYISGYDTPRFLQDVQRAFPSEWIFETRLYHPDENEPKPLPTEFAFTWLEINVSVAFSEKLRDALNDVVKVLVKHEEHWRNKTKRENVTEDALDLMPSEVKAQFAEQGAELTPSLAYLWWHGKTADHLMHVAEEHIARTIRRVRHASIVLRSKESGSSAEASGISASAVAREACQFWLLPKISKQEQGIIKALWPKTGASVGGADYDHLASNVWLNTPSDEAIEGAFRRLQKKMVDLKADKFLIIEFGSKQASLTIKDDEMMARRK